MHSKLQNSSYLLCLSLKDTEIENVWYTYYIAWKKKSKNLKDLLLSCFVIIFSVFKVILLWVTVFIGEIVCYMIYMIDRIDR